MNPQLEYWYQRWQFARNLSPAHIGRLVHADVLAPAPQDGQCFAGETAIAAQAAMAGTVYPYYRSATWLALAATLLSGLAIAVLVAWKPWVYWQATIAGMAIAMLISAYHLLGKNHGPGFIDAVRWQQATEVLIASGDAGARPLSLIQSLAFGAVMVCDGFFSGMTLTESAFEAVFTPNMAKLASLAWSVVMAFLLAEACIAAATESVINAKRHGIRLLSSSSQEVDQQRAEVMKSSLGDRLGHDYSTSANRYRARIALAVIVVALAASTFTVRIWQPEGATAVLAPVATTSF